VVEVVALFTDRELTRRRARRLATGVDRSGIFAGQLVPGVLAEEGEPVRLSGTGAWTGPLFVLVDGGTGSAAEDFVVWLQENGVAKVLGERTAGAGGGYVDGGGWIALTTAPFDVRAPNCARFLRDGTNEIEGIAPDVPLPMRGAAAAALAAALAKAVGG
jgi:C-terminal processing protease CtpA/Prc